MVVGPQFAKEMQLTVFSLSCSDYGYHRRVNSEDCTKDDDFKGPEIDICMRGHEEKLVTVGYRKLPQDQCQGGFSPKADHMVDLNKICEEGSKEVVEEDMGIVDYDDQLVRFY